MLLTHGPNPQVVSVGLCRHPINHQSQILVLDLRYRVAMKPITSAPRTEALASGGVSDVVYALDEVTVFKFSNRIELLCPGWSIQYMKGLIHIRACYDASACSFEDSSNCGNVYVTYVQKTVFHRMRL